jgi:hypothetical protein
MKTNTRYRLKYLLLAALVFLNPIMVSADALFSTHNHSTPTENVQKNTTAPLVGELEHASCHDEVPKNNGVDQLSIPDAQQDADDFSHDCCEETCSCSAASCHSASAAINTLKTIPSASQVTNDYAATYYRSYVATPSSPPPIA